MFMDRNTNIVKMSVLLNFIYRFNTTLITFQKQLCGYFQAYSQLCMGDITKMTV